LLIFRKYYLPKKYILVIVTVVNIPLKPIPRRPSRNYTGLYANWCTYSEAAFIAAGDFNKANLRKTLLKFYQHIDCSTHAGKTHDHCYSLFQDAIKALPRPPFGKSNHNSILLLPSYRQKLKQEVPVLRSIQCWSDQSESVLQDCFDHADWDMFPVASDNNIDVYTDTVTEFIRKCIGDVVP
jgi:hypothetical protein